MAGGALEFHPLDYEDVFSRNQRPKVDEYDDYLFIVLHFPRYDKKVSRLNAAELDLFVGPDYLITIQNEPLQAVQYLFDRVRTNEELREDLFSKGPGYLLYRIVDDSVDASFPMLRKMGNKLERIEEEIFEGEQLLEVVRDISNVKQEIINFRKIVRPQRSAFRDLERTRRATSPRTSTSTSTTSTTRPSASGTCSRTTRRSSRASSRPTSRRSRTAPTRPSGC